jgi:HK97 family phage portal protein
MTDNDDKAAAVHVDAVGGSGTLAKAENSTQLADRRIRVRGTGVKPPYNPDRLASFLELNETHAAAIRKRARYEVAFGFEITPHADVDAEEADEQERAVVRDFWRGRGSSWQTGPHQSAEPTTPEEVKELARQDYHSVGWCCLEILTDGEGRPTGLAHVPANTVRVRRPQSRYDTPRHPERGEFVSGEAAQYASRGYVQIRDGKRRYFGEAGDRYRGLEPTITGDQDDPRITYTPADGDGPAADQEPIYVDRETGDVAVGDASSLENGPANELIFIRNPSPLEQDYGVPDWVSAIRTIGADEAAKDYNREFFDNDTIPRFVIKVTGGELTEESKRDLRQMLHGLREESHRAVILEVEKFESQLDLGEDENIEIELEPLGQGISEEMDFRLFREKNEHEIAKVHEVPPILIGVTETSNRANSQEQVADFANNVIAPEQHKFAQRLYRLVHQQALGVTDWTLEYELRGADMPKEDADVARRKIQAVRGAIPIDRALEMIGEDPLPEDHPIDGQTLVADVGSDTQPVGQQPQPQPESDAVDVRAKDAPPTANKIGERDWLTVEAGLLDKEIEQTQFDSSNIDEGLYDFDAQELYLSFIRDDGSNSLYVYVDVPATEWAALTSASSAGSYHYDSIRLEYPYVEITNFHDRLPEGPSPDPEDVPEDIPSI